MTDKEKAKAYDEALEKARKYRDEEGFTEMEDVFPELRESEDERIRKWLYDYISYCPNTNFAFYDGIGKDAVLNYLEKQKKQKLVGNKKEEMTEFEQSVYDLCPVLGIEEAKATASDLLELAKKTLLKTGKVVLTSNYPEGCSFEDGFHLGYNEGFNTKQKEQKPAEWGEEDEKMLHQVLRCLDPTLPRAKREEIELWLKSLRPQPKVEWSEEDKAIVNCIACWLDGQFVTEAARKQCLEWFNKHRRDFLNSSSWKPSEEQMSMLLAVINDPNNAGAESCQIALKSLYEQLKKL